MGWRSPAGPAAAPGHPGGPLSHEPAEAAPAYPKRRRRRRGRAACPGCPSKAPRRPEPGQGDSPPAGSPAANATSRHHGHVPQVDPELDAALRRLRAAFGFVEVLEVVDHRADQDQATTPSDAAGQEESDDQPSPEP